MATQPMNYIDDTCDGFNIIYKLDAPNLFIGSITGLTTVQTIDYLIL